MYDVCMYVRERDKRCVERTEMELAELSHECMMWMVLVCRILGLVAMDNWKEEESRKVEREEIEE